MVVAYRNVTKELLAVADTVVAIEPGAPCDERTIYRRKIAPMHGTARVVLWLLAGMSESFDGGRCFSLPPSNRIGQAEDLIPAYEQIIAAGYPETTEHQIFEAWKSYRDSNRYPFQSPGNDSSSGITPIRFAVSPARRLVTYTVVGTVRMMDAKEFLDAVLMHPDFRAGFSFLGDRRKMVTARADDYARSVAALVEANREKLAPCRWAVIVANPVAYGMARMWA